tara:strand:- start:811 stop:2499 length:1689 start_codon:yes stop_codon:yes gene_type:complete
MMSNPKSTRLVSAVAVMAGALFAQDQQEQPAWKPPIYKLQRAQSQIAVDGKADEPAWKEAKSVGRFQFPWSIGDRTKEQSTVKLLWDDEYLYLLHTCVDSHITSRKRPHDSQIWKDDCFEIVIAPDPARPDFYFNIEWNLHGSLVDGHRPEGPKGLRVRSWTAKGMKFGASFKGTLNDDSDRDRSWTCEIAIPLTIFSADGKSTPPQPGDRWNVNFNRHNYLPGDGGLQYSQWSAGNTPKPAFHTPHRFGKVIFESEAPTARVATVAMHSELGDYETNLNRIRHWANKARKSGAKFVVFPELCITGSLCNSNMKQEDARVLARKAMQTAVPQLETLCKKLNMTMVVGIVEPVADGLRNSALVIGPQGHLTTFRKLWLPNEKERKWFEAGRRLPVVKSQGWKFSVGICADINYSEYFNAVAHQGAEMMLCPIGGSGYHELVNKPTGDQTKQAEFHRNLHMKFLPARAGDSRMYVFYANQAGQAGDYWYPGLALALDPRGKLVGEHRPTEGMIVTEVSKKLLAKARAESAPARVELPKNSAGQPVTVVEIDSVGGGSERVRTEN